MEMVGVVACVSAVEAVALELRLIEDEPLLSCCPTIGESDAFDSFIWRLPKPLVIPARGLAPPGTCDGPGLVMGVEVLVER